MEIHNRSLTDWFFQNLTTSNWISGKSSVVDEKTWSFIIRPSGCAGCGICAQNGRLQEKYFSIFFRWNDKNDTPIERARRDLLKTVLKVENGGLEGDLCNFLTPKFPDFTKFSTYLAARNSPLRGVPAEWWKFALTTGRPSDIVWTVDKYRKAESFPW